MQGKLKPIIANQVDAYTKLLLHGDGPDASTNIIDVTGKVVTPSGNARLAYSPKIGEGCVSFDGSGDYLEIPNSDDFHFYSDNFTIELWVKFIDITGGQIFVCQGFASNAYQSLQKDSDGTLRWEYQNSGEGSAGILAQSLSWSTNVWYHIALIRSANNWYLFRNGISVGDYSWGDLTKPTANMNTNLTIGSHFNHSILFFNGQMDELRISKGIARWTENFIPPTEPYSPDSYTKLLAHFENFSDSGATGHTITPNGNAHIETKKLGNNAIRLDENSSCLTILDNDDFAYGSGNFTIDCWIYIISFNSHAFIYRQWQDSEHELLIYVADNGSIRFHSYSGPGFEFIKETQAGIISLGQWYHIACVREGNTANVYVNGVKQSYPTYSTNPSGSLTNFSAPITIGVPFTQASFFIDEFRVSKGIARWGETFLTDFATAKTVTNSGVTPSSAIKKFGNSSAEFDGTNDMLTIPASSDWVLPGDFTIDAWIKIDIAKAQSIFACITAGGTYQYDLRLESDRQVAFYAYDGTTGTFLYGLGTGLAKIEIDVWTHVALVRSGSTVTIYLDGQAVATQNSTSEVYGTSNNLFGIGAFPDGEGLYFDGFIDELRVSKGIARWTANFVPPIAYHIVDAYDKLLLHLDVALFTPPSLPYSKEEVTKINFPGFQRIYDHVCDGSESKLSVAVDGDTDLEYQIMVRNTKTDDVIRLRLNNDSGSNYGCQTLYNIVGTISSERFVDTFMRVARIIATNSTTLSTPKGFIKTMVTSCAEHASGTSVGSYRIYGHTWNNTVNVTSLDFSPASGLFIAGTHITVFSRRSI